MMGVAGVVGAEPLVVVDSHGGAGGERAQEAKQAASGFIQEKSKALIGTYRGITGVEVAGINLPLTSLPWVVNLGNTVIKSKPGEE